MSSCSKLLHNFLPNFLEQQYCLKGPLYDSIKAGIFLRAKLLVCIYMKIFNLVFNLFCVTFTWISCSWYDSRVCWYQNSYKDQLGSVRLFLQGEKALWTKLIYVQPSVFLYKKLIWIRNINYPFLNATTH